MSVAIKSKPMIGDETDRELVHLLRTMKRLKPVDVVERLRIAVGKAIPTTLKSPLAEALFRGIEARQRIKEMEGGTLSAEEAGRILGLDSKQAVIDRYNKGRLLGWREKQGSIRFPVWQFQEDGNVLGGLPEALEVLAQNKNLDDWAKVLFFVNPRDSLKNQRPLDLLRKGEAERVIELARAQVE
jgi:hypothetical protein